MSDVDAETEVILPEGSQEVCGLLFLVKPSIYFIKKKIFLLNEA